MNQTLPGPALIIVQCLGDCGEKENYTHHTQALPKHNRSELNEFTHLVPTSQARGGFKWEALVAGALLNILPLQNCGLTEQLQELSLICKRLKPLSNILFSKPEALGEGLSSSGWILIE